MNTTLHRGITHPPDTEDRQVLQIPRPDELRRLALADRLSLRIGLWLLQRAQRPRRERRKLHLPPADSLILGERERSAAETYALLAYDLQRSMR
ncbi:MULTISPECIES: hypothetical protein [unclassified Microbacterium]|uniref:hypothetical protein n=1 Tax=unclassified Microbacterium TaxID=2609290 RepID=UPI000D514315|nr:hypothetical protein [Microbacterium sp. TPD7012]PVE95801.1 hypothetical protein DC434_09760 [Microbacterium sp. TPD7012]